MRQGWEAAGSLAGGGRKASVAGPEGRRWVRLEGWAGPGMEGAGLVDSEEGSVLQYREPQEP